jgi:hypothetical protein
VERRGSISQRCREGGSLSQCGRTWEHLRGEEKEGAYLSVGARGSISQGLRRVGVGGVYYRGGDEGEHIYGDEEKEGAYLSG